MSFILLGILNSQVEAGGAGAYDLLQTTVLGSNTASVTFSSLGSYSAYKHLQVRMVVKLSNVAGVADLSMRINSDTGSNYAWHNLTGDGSSVSSGASSSTNEIVVGQMAANASDTEHHFGSAVLEILDFSNSNKNTTIRALSGALIQSPSVSGGALVGRVNLRSSLWNDTAAVTSMSFFGSANILTGSRFSLYGIR